MILKEDGHASRKRTERGRESEEMIRMIPKEDGKRTISRRDDPDDPDDPKEDGKGDDPE